MKNVIFVNPKKLSVSNIHSTLYGEESDLESSLLFQTIREKGIVTPLIVDPNYVVISGVLRVKIALILKLESVPVVISDEPLEDYQVAMLNTGRQKLPSMIL